MRTLRRQFILLLIVFTVSGVAVGCKKNQTIPTDQQAAPAVQQPNRNTVPLPIGVQGGVVNQPTTDGCPGDVRICDNGIRLQRQAPDCEFPQCPDNPQIRWEQQQQQMLDEVFAPQRQVE